MSSLQEELAKYEAEHKIAMSKPFRMRLTKPPGDMHDVGLDTTWLFGMCETGRLRRGEKIRISGGDKPDVITEAYVLHLATAPSQEIFPWPREVAVIVKGVRADQIEVGMIVTRIDDETA